MTMKQLSSSNTRWGVRKSRVTSQLIAVPAIVNAPFTNSQLAIFSATPEKESEHLRGSLSCWESNNRGVASITTLQDHPRHSSAYLSLSPLVSAAPYWLLE